jgi:hypothetical protein
LSRRILARRASVSNACAASRLIVVVLMICDVMLMSVVRRVQRLATTTLPIMSPASTSACASIRPAAFMPSMRRVSGHASQLARQLGQNRADAARRSNDEQHVVVVRVRCLNTQTVEQQLSCSDRRQRQRRGRGEVQ